MAADLRRGRLTPIGWAGLIVGAAIMLAPLIWTLLLSLKDNAELVGHSEAALRAPYTLNNYAAILGNSLTLRWLLNSAIVAIGQTVGVLILASLAGYGFARLDFPFRRPLFIFVLVGLAIPSQAVILVQHQLFAWLHLHNSYPGLILPGLIAPFGVFFMTTYMRGIPRELDEAAMIDGAGSFRILRSVIVPQAKAAIVAVSLFHFFFAWNEFFLPQVYLQSVPDLQPLAVGLSRFNSLYSQEPTLIQAAALMAMALPLIVFFVAQRAFMRGVVFSGVEK